MIVVDASAILAILFDEPEGPALKRVLLDQASAVISPVNHWEVLVRIGSVHGDAGRQLAEALLTELDVAVADMTARHSRIAADAATRFGKATPARLNMGDCFAYALATTEGDGLLFKGDDFPKTDITSALP